MKLLGKTKIIEKNYKNPKWDESFSIKIDKSRLDFKTVALVVYYFDKVSEDDMIG